MNKLSVYFAMNGKTRDAMDFYKNCFGGEPIFTVIGESPMKQHFPEAMYNQILHAELTIDGLTLMASDMNGPEGFTAGNNVAVSVDLPDDNLASETFKKLAQNGTIIDDFKPQFWGGKMGVVTDMFGVKWMISCSV